MRTTNRKRRGAPTRTSTPARQIPDWQILEDGPIAALVSVAAVAASGNMGSFLATMFVYDDDRNGLSIVTETPDGALLYNFVRSADRYIENQRSGVLLYLRER